MNQRHDAVINFLRTRRSVPAKTMTGPGPDDTQVQEIINIAARVPDHGKLTPWRFIRYSPDYCVVLGENFVKRALERNPDLNKEMQTIERERFTRVPVVVGVISRATEHPKIPQWEQILSAGAAAMNLLIAANAYGWDAQWLTEWIAFDETLAESLGVKTQERIAGFIYMGTRTLPKTDRERPALDRIFTTLGE
jgi:nitroreductase